MPHDELIPFVIRDEKGEYDVDEKNDVQNSVECFPSRVTVVAQETELKGEDEGDIDLGSLGDLQ